MKETGVMHFAGRIRTMNTMYKLPVHDLPMLPENTADRLGKFKRTLQDEINEIDDIIADVASSSSVATPLNVATAIADVLADITVYCRSEALKYGIPLEAVLDIIMDSNESKLGADGKPIYNEDGKFLKGPNYWKPEPKIAKMLSAGIGVVQGGWK